MLVILLAFLITSLTEFFVFRDCQRMEWKVHKILHKEIEHTRNILQKMD